MKFHKIGIFAPIAIAATLGSCGKQTDVRLNVHIDSPENTTIYLSKLDFGRSAAIDSARVSSGHSTKKFRIAQSAEPSFYTVTVGNYGTVTLLAEQSENITLTLNPKALNSYTVSGSDGSERVRQIAVTFAQSRHRLDSLSRLPRAQAEEQMEQEVQQQKAHFREFIMQNPMSMANAMAIYLKYHDGLYLFDSSDDLPIIKTVASAINALYPESSYATGMLNDVKRIERLISRSKVNDMMSQLDSQLPDIELETITGQPRKLSELKGKLVLLSFWHSQHPESLMDNRDLLEIYPQLKARGLEVYQVGLDSSRTQWANAVAEHKLPWISVFGGDNALPAITYNVSQLPTTYLIDRKQQNVLGKNLRGDKLRKTITDNL